VYDITKLSSFKTLKSWVEELQTQGPKDISIAIAGNKADLADRRVSSSVVVLYVLRPDRGIVGVDLAKSLEITHWICPVCMVLERCSLSSLFLIFG
jgi:GTPase SAR1 family protein